MKKQITLSIVFTLLSYCSFSQKYSFSSYSKNYQELSAPVSLNKGKAWDEEAYSVPLGFNFELFGKPMSTLFLNGGSLILSDTNLGTTSKQLSVLAMFGADLVDRAGADTAKSSLSPLSYKLTGSVGNRILKIQMKNVGFWGEWNFSSSTADYANFQVWLYEGSNIIEAHIGPNSIKKPLQSFGGETGPSFWLINNYDAHHDRFTEDALALTGSPANPQMASDTNTWNHFLAGVPSSGTVYKFSPSVTLGEEHIEDKAKELKLYPNPTNNKLFFESEISFNESTNWRVFDLAGNLVKEGTVKNMEAIDVSVLRPGLYLFEISVKGERKMLPFSKV